MKTLLWLIPFFLVACTSAEKTIRLDEPSISEEEVAPPIAPEPISLEGKDCRSSVGFISHGQSMTFFRNRRVPEGFECERETRTCNNGQLSGSFEFSSCIAVP
jgi:hypothetical protein